MNQPLEIEIILDEEGKGRKQREVPVSDPLEVRLYNRMLVEAIIQKGRMSPEFEDSGNLDFSTIMKKKMYYCKFFKRRYPSMQFIFPKDQSIYLIHLGYGLGS